MTFTSASEMMIANVCLCQAGSTLVFVGFVVMISAGVEEDEVDSEISRCRKISRVCGDLGKRGYGTINKPKQYYL